MSLALRAGGEPDGSFKRGLLARVREVERFADAEANRLEEIVRSLSAENARLSALLGSSPNHSNLGCHSVKLRKGNKIPDPDVSPTASRAGDAGADQAGMSPTASSGSRADGGAAPARAQALLKEAPTQASAASDEREAAPERSQSSRTDKSAPVDGARKLGRSKSSIVANPLGLEIDAVLKRIGDNKPHQLNTRHDLYRDDGICQAVCRSHWFEYLTLAMVLSNAIWVGVDMDWNGKALPDSDWGFQLMEHLFCTFFVVEMSVRYLATKSTRMAVTDRWFVFDGLLVVTMILETWVLVVVMALTRRSNSLSIGQFAVLRILRLLRLTRLARVCHMVPELKTMVSGMLQGVRSVMVAGVILSGITYLFAIIVHALSEGTGVGADRFSTVFLSMGTLLIEGMLPDNREILDNTSREHWYLGVILFCFLCLSTITIMNMLIGILCDVMTRVSHTETEKRELDRMSHKLQTMMAGVDGNDDGKVSISEFKGIVKNDEAVKILRDVGVDVKTLVEDVDFIFEQHGKETIDFEDFKEIILQFRQTNLATIRTISNLRKYNQKGFDDVHRRMRHLEDHLRAPRVV